MVSFPSEVLEQLRVHLETEKQKLAKEMADLTEQDPFSNADRTNDKASSDSSANAESSHDRFAAMVDEIKKKLADTDGALMRIGNGTYGFCTVCGDMIDTDRLSILPTATVCLKHSK